MAAARGEAEIVPAAAGLFDSCIAAIPYAPATAFLANEKAKLDTRRADGETPRVAMLADGIGSTHGVTRVIEEIRQRGVPGFEIEVLGTDPNVDRRLSAVAEFDVPYYPGLQIGVPSLSAAVQTLADGCFDLIHVCSPGPVGVAGALVSRGLGLPLVGSYHTELTAYAGLRSGERGVAEVMAFGVARSTARATWCSRPARHPTRRWPRWGWLAQRGGALGSWRRQRPLRSGAARRRRPCRTPSTCSTPGASPARRGPTCSPTPSCRRARSTRGCSSCSPAADPSRSCLRERVGDAATFLGWLEGDELARAYASADIFLFPSRTDTFGQVILEAQASGLPVLAVAAGGPLSLIEDGVSGLLRAPDAGALAEAAAGAGGLAAAARAPGPGRPCLGQGAHVGARARAPQRRLPARARSRASREAARAA